MKLSSRIAQSDTLNAVAHLAGCVWFCGALVHWVGWEAWHTAKWAMRRQG